MIPSRERCWGLLQRPSMPLIWCSISGHGYGHAAQVAPVLNALGRLMPNFSADPANDRSSRLLRIPPDDSLVGQPRAAGCRLYSRRSAENRRPRHLGRPSNLACRLEDKG